MTSIPDENTRMKFENMLSKKVKQLELLSQSLVYKERELLDSYRDRMEEDDLEENTGKYEKRGLLDDASDEEEEEED